MRALLAFSALLIIAIGEALAFTVEWACNPESDMKEYRVEYSADGGASWGIEATVPHPKPCTSPVSMGVTRYLKSGSKLYRVFAIDKAGNVSMPSESAPYTVKPPLIGNPGGQEEAPIPPSPYRPSPTPAPPPPVVTPPSPPPVAKPGDVAGFAAGSITQDSAIISGTVPDGAKINLRYMKAPLSWGAATSAACESLPCTITGLTPDTAYQAQCIPYFGAMNQGAIYGNFCPTVTIKTLPAPVPPPDLEPRMKAIQDRLDGIEEMGAVLDAEMQEVRGTMRALCRALKGNCP